MTFDNLSKSLNTFPLGFYPSLLSSKTSGFFWPLRKSSAFFMLYPRCSDPTPSNTCNKCHMSRALTPSLGSYAYQKQEGNTHLVKPDPISWRQTGLGARADRYSLLCSGLSPPTPCRLLSALLGRPPFY